MTHTWRSRCAELIRATIKANQGKSEREIRAALRKVYPWGPREHWPYKVWLDEIRRQLGKPSHLHKPRKGTKAHKDAAHAAATLDLFGGSR